MLKYMYENKGGIYLKHVKMYNVIFPVWLIWLFPPIVFISLAGNFVIDSLVILLGFKFLHIIDKTGMTSGTLYKKSIIKVWLFGFLSDFIGAVFLLLIPISDFLPQEIIASISFNPFNNVFGLLIVLISMLIASFIIYFLNYRLTFKWMEDAASRKAISLLLAIVTSPWTFLIPTGWFYS